MKTATTETTYWHCEACGAKGRIEYAARTDVYSVVLALQDAHEKASPDCKTDLMKIRVSPAPINN